jgi:hypothetical protein
VYIILVIFTDMNKKIKFSLSTMQQRFSDCFLGCLRDGSSTLG